MTDREIFDLILKEIGNLKSDMQDIKQKTSNIESDVADIKLTLENEIRTNIKRVAEGHLDLSRDLKAASKTNNEFEMLAVRVNVLESDVRN